MAVEVLAITSGEWVLENFDIERGTVEVNTKQRGADVPSLGYHIATVSAAREDEPDALVIKGVPSMYGYVLRKAQEGDSEAVSILEEICQT